MHMWTLLFALSDIKYKFVILGGQLDPSVWLVRFTIDSINSNFSNARWLLLSHILTPTDMLIKGML